MDYFAFILHWIKKKCVLYTPSIVKFCEEAEIVFLSQWVWFGGVLSVLAESVRASNYSCPTCSKCECGALQAGLVTCDQQTTRKIVNIEMV